MALPLFFHVCPSFLDRNMETSCTSFCGGDSASRTLHPRYFDDGNVFRNCQSLGPASTDRLSRHVFEIACRTCYSLRCLVFYFAATEQTLFALDAKIKQHCPLHANLTIDCNWLLPLE